MHRLTTILAIALMLACPYACSGGVTCCGMPGEQAPQACCAHCAQSTTGDETSLPAEGDPCDSSCLCKGAVLTEAAPLVKASDAFLFDLPTVESHALALRTEIVHECAPVSHWPGDSLRIAIASLTC